MSEFKKKIIEIFETMLINQQRMITLLEARVPPDMDPDMDDPSNWLSPEKTMEELTICQRTLFSLRKNEELTWRKKGGRYYYFKPDIFRIRNHHIK